VTFGNSNVSLSPFSLKYGFSLNNNKGQTEMHFYFSLNLRYATVGTLLHGPDTVLRLVTHDIRLRHFAAIG